MTFALTYPAIDPVLLQIGPLAIRWYALAYVAGLLLGWRYMRVLTTRPPLRAKPDDIDDFLTWAVIGVVGGGRLGYVLFYQPTHFLEHPLEAFTVWRGGMSFHGGLLGVVIAALLFVRARGLSGRMFGDLLGCAAPIGLFFGRIANFINGELWGRVADVPWAMVFPHGGPWPRHPSQLYEALLEGAVLFVLTFLLYRREAVRRRPGLTMGVFLAGYGIARSIAELFRQPDAFLGFLVWEMTMGQLLSLPMILLGLYFIVTARRT